MCRCSSVLQQWLLWLLQACSASDQPLSSNVAPCAASGSPAARDRALRQGICGSNERRHVVGAVHMQQAPDLTRHMHAVSSSQGLCSAGTHVAAGDSGPRCPGHDLPDPAEHPVCRLHPGTAALWPCQHFVVTGSSPATCPATYLQTLKPLPSCSASSLSSPRPATEASGSALLPTIPLHVGRDTAKAWESCR